MAQTDIMLEPLDPQDYSVLRELGKRLCEIGNLPEMEERRRLWRRLNGLAAERPMVLVETSGVLQEIVPSLGLCCRGEWARSQETAMRLALYHYENIPDDMVIEPWITYGERVTSDFYGVQVVEHIGDAGGTAGSRRWDPPVTDINRAPDMLRFRTFTLDRSAGAAQQARLEDVFSGVVPVVRRGWYWWSTGMTENAIKLIGLEGLMLAMMDSPDALHWLMGFLRDDMQRMLDWHQAQGLLLPNNRDDYIGSGGRGYTDDLPQAGYRGGPACIGDLWGLSESQETVGVSPGMFGEFIFPYQLPIISQFGLACYGCCEPVDRRWQYIRQIKNLRRVSVSPWANEEKMAEYLGTGYVYNRKPNPTGVSTANFDEDALNRELEQTLRVTRGGNVDIVLKDVHTVAGQPWRLGRWARLAKDAIFKSLG